MSQLKLSGDASGTGIVTVAAPNTNSTYTVTLPAAAGTIVTGAAGSDTQVQFNDSGSFGGDAGLTYNKTTDTLTTGVVVHGAGTASAPSVTTTGDTNTGVFFPAADTAAITTGGSERMRILSGGKVLINATTDRDKWDNSTIGSNLLQVERSASSANSSISVTNNPGTYADAFSVLYLGRSRGTANNDYTAVASGDGLGVVSFQGADGTEFVEAASVRGYVDGTPGANDMPGRLVFFTTPDGSATPTERMRINSSGYLLVGYTSSNGSYNLQVNSQIFATSATIATSDGRYKENVTPLTGALDIVKALNPVQFQWKQHPVHNFDRSCPTVGFIAQEVQQVLADKPYLNSIIKANECEIEPAQYETIVLEPAVDEVKDDEGNIIVEAKEAVTEQRLTREAVKEDFYGIAEGNMIAILTKALQESIARIEQLEAKVAALKGA